MTQMRTLLALLVAGTLPALAQTPHGWSASAALADGAPSLNALTGGGPGFALDGAWDSSGVDLPGRIGIGLSSFGGKTHTVTDPSGDAVTASGPSLRTAQVYASLRSELMPGLNLYLGLSANRHRLGADLTGQGSAQNVKGLKLGTRVDLEYALSPRIALVGTFQWVEVGLASSNQAMNAPSWFQCGARWSF